MNTYMHRPHTPFASLAFNALPATLATAALVLLMHSLIATDFAPPEIKPHERIEFIGKVPEMSEPQKTERPQKPDEVAPTPDRITPKIAHNTDELVYVGRGDTFRPVTKGEPISTGTNMVVPFLKLQPEYPSRALKRGIEGYVDLAFDITAAGTTSNIRVIESQPEGVFDRAAIRALERWKYKVPVTDGKPQGQVDMMTRLRFELDR